jgi:Uma2 family endonuclease
VVGRSVESHMAETAKPGLWTYSRYRSLPDDGKRYEILRGELVVTLSPKSKHQVVAWNLSAMIREYLREHDLGTGMMAPMDVVLADDVVVQPDILVVRKERLHIIGEEAVTAAPDLIVEVLSESTRQRDHLIKRRLYAEHGVREYWLVDPDIERVEIFVLDAGQLVLKTVASEGGVESPAVLPGFRVEVASLFE